MPSGVHIGGRPADVAEVQAVAVRAPVQSVDDSTPGRLTRLWRLPLGWHAAALFVVLLAAMLVTLPNQLGHADEGVAHAQAQLLADGDGWSTPHPIPAADPEGHAFPLGGSTQREGTDEYVPFSKHPVYPVMLVPFVGLFGVAGGALLSVFGTVAAAIGTALLARRLDPALARPALWSLGVATPMWFDSFVTIAHPLGAAAIVFAALFLLRPSTRAHHMLCGWGFIVLAVLLRNEAILLGAALGAVLLVTSMLRAEWRSVVVGGGAFAAAMLGYLLDARLTSMTLGGDAVEPFTIEHEGSFVAERLDGFAYTVLAPSDRTATGLLLGTLGLVFVLAAALVVRRRPEDTSGLLLFLGGAVAVESLRWLVEPGAHIPGLVFAAPLLLGGLALLDRATVVRREVAVLLAASALFFVGVVATQYSNGGGGGWGGRYFAIALPLVVPVALLAVRRSAAPVAVAARPVAVGLCIAIAAVLAVGQSTSLLVDHRLNRSFERAIADATTGLDAGDGDPRPVVVSTRRGLGRMAFSAVLTQRWLEVPSPDDDVVPYLERLDDLGVARVVLVTADADEILARIESRYAVAKVLTVAANDPLGRSVSLASEVIVLHAVKDE